MNKLVIFDLDGVLFESRDMHFETLNKGLTHYGYPPITYEDHVQKYNGLPTSVKLAALGIEGEAAEQVNAEKQAHTLGWVYKNVRQNPMLHALFDALKGRNYQIAVASNAITMTVMRALQLLGLWEMCDFVVSPDRGFPPKPAPDMYFRCMEVCGSDPANTIIVEDSPVGLEGARATGATVIAVRGPADVPIMLAHAVKSAETLS